jgi:pimeloyl-ACP methyl ester carboxylesterase
MPTATIRGAAIVYEVLGKSGPWVALTPGGRRGLVGVKSLAERVADLGYRVVIHDRRNTGASDVVLEGDETEYEIWADDLHALLTRLDALPAWIGGRSSGCRMSVLFALRHPQATRGLLMTGVTGGRFACERLAENYYGQYMKAAEKGGMAAVCETEHFAECIAANPSNRARIMSMDVKRFLAGFARWREPFIHGAELPMIGVTEENLRSIRVPTYVVPGNDHTHNRPTGERVGKIIPGAETHILLPIDRDVDLAHEDWDEKEDELAHLLDDFMRRKSQRAA